jgi:threonine/homoserine/homoserine lactone efflux protein
VALGFPVMLFLLALGLGELFQRSEALREGCAGSASAVMLWLSWRIGTAGRARAERRARPFTFLEAAAFQWVNPKAWALAVGVPAPFWPAPRRWRGAALRGGVRSERPVLGPWLGAVRGGAAPGLSTDARLRAFNAVMGALLAACAAYLAVAEL